MPINSFSVGRDLSLDIIGPGGPISLSLITGFNAKPDYAEIRIKGLDGVTRNVRFPDGWSGSFDIERQDGTIDSYFAQLEDDYYAGQDELPVTITETIQEADGSISQFRYEGVLLKLDDGGEWRGDQTVKMRVSFIASRRRQVA